MKLQVAMDVLTIEAALELAGKVAEHVDIIELGTPLVKNEGLSAITAIKTAHPDKIVFADLKTMDAGELEADIAFKAGADLVSVLGSADDSTIAGAVKAAKAHNKGIVVDLIGVAGQGDPRQGSPRPGREVHRDPRRTGRAGQARLQPERAAQRRRGSPCSVLRRGRREHLHHRSRAAGGRGCRRRRRFHLQRRDPDLAAKELRAAII